MSRYERGRRGEYELKKSFEKKGFTVLRTAGSHGCADLIVFNDRNFYLIQVKRGKESNFFKVKKIYKSEIEEFSKVKVPEFIKKEFWYRQDRGVWMIHAINGGNENGNTTRDK